MINLLGAGGGVQHVYCAKFMLTVTYSGNQI